MRLAFVGKGGSGKTTASSLFIRFLLSQGHPVLAIDADINQHLAEALHLPDDQVAGLPELGNALPRLKALLLGSNDRISGPAQMVKTTPPGAGSHLVTLGADDAVLREFSLRSKTLHFLRVGGFQDEDLGTRCFHAKTGAVELILNHLVDGPRDWVITDMTAGADAFASGLFTRFDVTVLVVEPTRKSLSVYDQYKRYAQDYDVAIRVLGNKVQDEEDRAFLQDVCGADLIGALSQSPWIRQSERGHAPAFADLEPDNRAVLKALQDTAARHRRDWDRYWHWGIHFHEKNAVNWANEAVGADVTDQIDRAFLKRFAALPEAAGTDQVAERSLDAPLATGDPVYPSERMMS